MTRVIHSLWPWSPDAPGGPPSPSWTLDFTGTPSGYTLTRASTGTFVDSSGYVASASTNVARLTHNSSGSRLGLLVEAAATNVAQYSEDFNNAYWTKSGLTTPLNNNGGSFYTSPANTATALLMEQTTAAATHRLERAFSGTDRNFAIFVKKQNLTTGSGRAGRYVTLLLRGVSTDYVHATFDLDTGTKTAGATVVGTVFSGADAGIEAYANDWYRVWITATRASGTATCIVALATTGTPTMTSQGESYTGANATDGIYVWGAQSATRNAPPTSYIPVAATITVTRSADIASVATSNITGFANNSTLLVEYYRPATDGMVTATNEAVSSVGKTGYIGVRSTATATQSDLAWDTSFLQSGANGNLTGTVNATLQKFAYTINSGGTVLKSCMNGSMLTTTKTGGDPDMGLSNTLFLGQEEGGIGYSNVIIRKVAFYNSVLSDADMQTITT